MAYHETISPDQSAHFSSPEPMKTDAKLTVRGLGYEELAAMSEDDLADFIDNLTPDEQEVAAKILKLDATTGGI